MHNMAACLIEAHQAGVDAAKASATWLDIDSEAHARKLLKMIEDGDPRLDEHLPRMPNLSGEFSGDPTPLSLAREITGKEDPSPDDIDELADAFEDGVGETFELAIEARILDYLNR